MLLTFHSAAIFITTLTVIDQKVDGARHILTPGTSPASPVPASLGYSPNLSIIRYTHAGAATLDFALLVL